MADEFVISALDLRKANGESGSPSISSNLEVDAVIETDFTSFRDGQSNLSLPELCAEIELLGTANLEKSLDRVAIEIADGLMELFPQVAAVDITVRVPDPSLPEAKVASFGARLRRRREPERKSQSSQPGKRPRPIHRSRSGTDH